MFDFDEKKYCGIHPAPPPMHRPPFDHMGAYPAAKPRYTMTEELEHTAAQMRETIDRLLRFEERAKREFDDLAKNVSSDNVIFKSTMREAWTAFIQEVKNEINVFEGNVDATVHLFQKDTESNYATLSEDVHNQIAESLKTFSDKVTAFETAYNAAFEAFRDSLNARVDAYYDTQSSANADYQLALTTRVQRFEDEMQEAFADYQTALTESVDSFKTVWAASIEDRLDAQDAKISDAEAYMKTNLNTSLDTLLHAMKEDGLLTGVIESDVLVTPEMYGAVGDGVNDDTAAIKACLKSGNVVMLSKKYRITSVLRFDGLSDVFMFGGEIVRDADAVFNTIHGENCSNIHIVNVTFDGNGNSRNVDYAWSDSAQGCILLVGDSSNIFVEKCVIKNHNYGVFTLGADGDNLSVNATIRDCKFINCHSAIDTYGKGITIDHNVFYRITENAIQLEACGEPEDVDPVADANFWQNAMCCVISNNLLLDVAGTGIIVHSNAYGVKIDNNTIVNFKVAINANRTFIGCFVTNNTVLYQNAVDVTTERRPWAIEYAAVYCGENVHVEGNFLKRCYTAIVGTYGSIIKGNEIVNPVVAGVAVSSSHDEKVHFIADNIVKDFTHNANAWWGAYPFVLNGGKSALFDNIVYADCEPVCVVDAVAVVRNLVSAVAQTTAIPSDGINVYQNS